MLIKLRGGWGEWPLPQSHATQSVPLSACTSVGWSPETGASGTPVRGRRQSGSQENGRNGLRPEVTPQLLTAWESSWTSISWCRQLMLYGGECSTQERRLLLCGRVTQHRDPGGCPSSSLPRATHPRLSSCDSSQLYLSFARAQSEWLQMRFRALAL